MVQSNCLNEEILIHSSSRLPRYDNVTPVVDVETHDYDNLKIKLLYCLQNLEKFKYTTYTICIKYQYFMKRRRYQLTPLNESVIVLIVKHWTVANNYSLQNLVF